MPHIEIMQNCLAGKNLKQIPVSFWRHFPLCDDDTDQFVKATLKWQYDYDFDFVKVMPPSSYCVKDWGSVDRYAGNSLGIREYIHFPINTPDNWLKLKVLDPDSGHLKKQMDALKVIIHEFRNKVPVVCSVFNPLSQMMNLCQPSILAGHFTKYPQAAAEGLKTITQSTIRLIEKMIEIGLDGIYFIVKEPDFLSEIQAGCKIISWSGYDLLCLEAAKKLWMNVLHLHTLKVEPTKFENYPAQIISVHGLHRADLLQAIQSECSGKLLCGGLQRFITMARGTAADVVNEAEKFANSLKTQNYILGAECGLPLDTPEINIRTAINFARERQML